MAGALVPAEPGGHLWEPQERCWNLPAPSSSGTLRSFSKSLVLLCTGPSLGEDTEQPSRALGAWRRALWGQKFRRPKDKDTPNADRNQGWLFRDLKV